MRQRSPLEILFSFCLSISLLLYGTIGVANGHLHVPVSRRYGTSAGEITGWSMWFMYGSILCLVGFLISDLYGQGKLRSNFRALSMLLLFVAIGLGINNI